jgi:dephospho-CoA kinase
MTSRLGRHFLLRSNIFNHVLGITGSVATGKSTVAQMFADLGAVTISADIVARDVLAPGSAASKRIIEEVGTGVAVANSIDEVDRAKLGALIYQSDPARKLVGEIMHPPIHAILSEQIDSARIDPAHNLVVAEIPLLFENKLEAFVDKILVVTCSETTQIGRILARYPGLSKSDAIKRIHSQLPLTQKAEMADFAIDTDQPLDDARADVVKILALLKRK